mmetsp:Transcript_62038/g.119559  ORF Transcript_62038/g.119559 Transcript_62038/m.119559 type:complete len:291 (+) Transcript_62038:677-1549(+)
MIPHSAILQVDGHLIPIILRGHDQERSFQYWDAVHAKPTLPGITVSFYTFWCSNSIVCICKIHELDRLIGQVGHRVAPACDNWHGESSLVNPQRAVKVPQDPCSFRQRPMGPYKPVQVNHRSTGTTGITTKDDQVGRVQSSCCDKVLKDGLYYSSATEMEAGWIVLCTYIARVAVAAAVGHKDLVRIIHRTGLCENAAHPSCFFVVFRRGRMFCTLLARFDVIALPPSLQQDKPNVLLPGTLGCRTPIIPSRTAIIADCHWVKVGKAHKSQLPELVLWPRRQAAGTETPC